MVGPSVELDVMTVNSLAAPLLAAGFYYKTFMGPTRGAWMFYEPFIRRAAGLGAQCISAIPIVTTGDMRFADVLVIRLRAGRARRCTDSRPRRARAWRSPSRHSLLGGSLLLESVAGPAEEWRRQIEAELESLSNVEILRRTTALGALRRQYGSSRRAPRLTCGLTRPKVRRAKW